MAEAQVIQITGAAGGFGTAIAERLADAGAALILSDRNEERLDTLAKRLKAGGATVFAEAVDVSDDAAMRAHLERGTAALGRLSAAINNAGVAHDLAPLHLLEPDQFDRVLRVNARGVFIGMRHQIAAMIATGGGAILNIASVAGLVGAGTLGGYAASKHAVVGLTRTAADEYARHGIRVNALCPAFAETPMLDRMTAAMDDTARGKLTARIPMRRTGTAAEVADAALWLISPANSFMTGQAIALDGGLSAI
ncbi:MAG: SDR family NAD(P)-dependent oxidoreductase [Rubricella sp.]